MAAPVLNLETVIDRWVAALRKRYAPDTVRTRRCNLRVFLKLVGDKPLADLSLRDIAIYQQHHTRPDGSPSPMYNTAIVDLRHFMRWASATYKVPLPIPYTIPKTASRAGFGTNGLRDRLDSLAWHDRIMALPKKLTAPHQRAVFLTAFTLCLGIKPILEMTWQNIYRYPLRKDLYMALVECQRFCDGEPLVFRRWLGTSHRTAYKRWKVWAGDIPFREVARAGNRERVRAAIRPTTKMGAAGRQYLSDLPEATAALLERLPQWWPPSDPFGVVSAPSTSHEYLHNN